MRKGVLAGGNWIIDQVKIIDNYPEQEVLANILDEFNSNGGSPYNILKDLKKLAAPFPLEGVGLVGNDERGNKIIEECKSLSINTTQINQTSEALSSYTDVMSVQSTGKRTFFHQRGANALLDEINFNFEISNARIFHLGYLLLLDKLDRINSDGTTGASRVLKRAKNQGIITTVDLVSENSNRFTSIVPPSLTYIDYLFVNEYEAGKLAEIQILDNSGNLSKEYCYAAANKILQLGVNEWVIVHFPEGTLAVHKKGKQIFQPCVNISSEMIAGAVGAGDAFAAGVLFGIHENWEMRESLQLGVCSAASSLFKATCSDSVLPYNECIKLGEKFGYKESHIAANSLIKATSPLSNYNI